MILPSLHDMTEITDGSGGGPSLSASQPLPPSIKK